MGNHGQRDVPQRGRGRVGLEVLYLVVLWYVGWVVVDVSTDWVDVRNGLLSRGCSLVLSVLRSAAACASLSASRPACNSFSNSYILFKSGM
jgi:hypothetical protein